MKKGAIFLIVGLALLASSTWAGAEKVVPTPVTGDLAPAIGPVAFGGSDNPWDVLFTSNIQALTGNQLFLGGAYAGGFYLCAPPNRHIARHFGQETAPPLRADQ